MEGLDKFKEVCFKQYRQKQNRCYSSCTIFYDAMSEI